MVLSRRRRAVGKGGKGGKGGGGRGGGVGGVGPSEVINGGGKK